MALDTATNSFYKPADKRGTKESVQYAKDDTPLRQPVTGEMPSGTLTTLSKWLERRIRPRTRVRD